MGIDMSMLFIITTFHRTNRFFAVKYPIKVGFLCKIQRFPLFFCNSLTEMNGNVIIIQKDFAGF